MKLTILLILFSNIAICQTGSSGYVLQMSDGSIRMPDNSISINKVNSLQAFLDAKQTTLVSGTNIKTINSTSLLGSGDIVISGGVVSFADITGDVSDNSNLQTAFNAKQNTIAVGAISEYIRGDLSLATFPTTTASFSNSTNKNFVTDAQLTVIGNTSGINTGDNAVNSNYDNDFRAANFVAGTNYIAPNGSAANLTSFPTFNQNTTGTAGGLSANISEAQVTNLVSDLSAKAPLASPTFTGTVSGVTKAMVGLPNVDNTTDAGKPVSTATQTALNAKAPLYTAGAGTGGTVTQATNKATGVTLNKICGQITMNGAALAAAAEVSFVVTNNTVASTDVVIVNVQSVGTAVAYFVTVGAVSNGSFAITVGNASTGSLSQALVLNFAVIKSVSN